MRQRIAVAATGLVALVAFAGGTSSAYDHPFCVINQLTRQYVCVNPLPERLPIVP